MLDHVSIGTHNLARAADFYAQVLAPLGYRITVQNEKEAGLGSGDDWVFFLYPVAEETPVIGARSHIALRARSRHEVAAAHAAALRHGATAVPDRDPAERPQFGADYYGCVFTDLDGHAIELMTRAAV